MTTDLREALTQLQIRGSRVATQAANDGIGGDLAKVMDAARDHLGCGTATPEMFEAASEAVLNLKKELRANAAHLVARAAVEAAVRVREETK